MALVASAADAAASFSIIVAGMCPQPFYNPAFVFTGVGQSRYVFTFVCVSELCCVPLFLNVDVHSTGVHQLAKLD